MTSAVRGLMIDWLGGRQLDGPHSVCDSMVGQASLTEAGLGISFLPLAFQADRIESGKLQKLRTQPDAPKVPFAMVYPSRQQNLRMMRILAEFAVNSSSFDFSD